MFKPLCFNHLFTFDVEGNVRYRNQPVEVVGDFVEVEVNGDKLRFERRWLGLIAHYEVNLPLGEFWKISFVDAPSKVLRIKCGKLMVFKKPIVLDDGFRIIPGFPHFAVNSDGQVKSLIKNGKILKQHINPYGYPTTHIYDPDKGQWRTVTVHLLVARAFVENNDPIERVYVNHIDGDKLNCNPSNLEWVTERENVVHAVFSGLRSDNSPCLLRSAITGVITPFPSVGSALLSLGFKSLSSPLQRLVNGVIVSQLFAGEYEIKYLDDQRNWYYTDASMITSRNVNKGPFQAKRLDTGEVFENESVVALSNRTGVSPDRIRTVLYSIEPKAAEGYLFRQKSDAPWPDDYQETIFHKPRKFQATHIETGEVQQFLSSRQLRGFLGMDKKTLNSRLQTGEPYKEWLVTEIKEDR